MITDGQPSFACGHGTRTRWQSSCKSRKKSSVRLFFFEYDCLGAFTGDGFELERANTCTLVLLLRFTATRSCTNMKEPSFNDDSDRNDLTSARKDLPFKQKPVYHPYTNSLHRNNEDKNRFMGPVLFGNVFWL
jgi:hypothetical protein